MGDYGRSWLPKYCQAKIGRPNCLLKYRASQFAGSQIWSMVLQIWEKVGKLIQPVEQQCDDDHS
eukprot:10577442-Karenia_brevis.AAC.1